MAYEKRDWDNTGTSVTKSDFKRMEGGIEANDKRFNVLDNDRGYLVSKEYDNFNIITNGKYLINHASPIADSPLPQVVSSKWALDVTAIAVGIKQTATLVWSDTIGYFSRGKAFTRIYVDGTWSAWIEVATVTKTNFTLTPTTGFEIENQDCYTMNGEFTISALFKRTDGGVISGSQRLTSPTPLALPIVYVGSAMGLSTTWKETVSGCWLDGTGVTIVTTSSAATKIYLTIKGRVL